MFTKSPLNYVGGKFDLLKDIIPLFPPKIDSFVDLFCGGLNVGVNVNCNHLYANDINLPLIDLYRYFKETSIDSILSRIYKRIEELRLSIENKDGYRRLREAYNNDKNSLDFFLLICYSFSHQIRFNKFMEFNMPFGKSKSAYNSTIENNLIRFCDRLNKLTVSFSSFSFEEFNFDILKKGDVVYCDPPYSLTVAPYNEESGGNKDGWGQKEDKKLTTLLDSLDKRGILFFLSDVLSHNGRNNDFLIQWGMKYRVVHISKSYSNANYHLKIKNGFSDEVIITNYIKFIKNSYFKEDLF